MNKFRVISKRTVKNDKAAINKELKSKKSRLKRTIKKRTSKSECYIDYKQFELKRKNLRVLISALCC